MKKNISYITLIYFICRSTFIGITFTSLSTLTKQNACLSTIIGFLIGFIPISLFYLIASYKPELNIVEKIDYLFPKIHNIIKLLLFIIIFFLSLLVFWNLTNLANTQFLNKTPLIIISISFIIPVIYLISKDNKTFLRVCIILFYISLILFITSLIGLANKIKIYNTLPLEYNPFKGIIPYISYSVLPVFPVLIFPNDKIQKYLFKGYLMSSIFILLATFLTISVLGIKLTNLLQYPELFVLKNSFQKLISFRLENFLIIQWVFDMFIYISLGLKYCNESFKIKHKYILPIILVITNCFIFTNIMTENKLIIYIFPKIIPIFLFIIPLLILIKTKKVV